MRYSFLLILFSFLLFACHDSAYVHISGQIIHADSIVSIYTEDSVYRIEVDKNNFFEAHVRLVKPAYISLYSIATDIYVSPDEDLEIYADAQNVSTSLYFRGSLGRENNYMHEQGRVTFFEPDAYELGEKDFIVHIEKIIHEQIQLLEAKNLYRAFTALEKQRIRYEMGEKLLLYPRYYKQLKDTDYQPQEDFFDYLSTFPIHNDDLEITNNYKKFALNYAYFQGGRNYDITDNDANKIADFILKQFPNEQIRDFLLPEVIVRFIWENNGLENAAYLVQAFKENSHTPSPYIQTIVSGWENLLPGSVAPDFTVESINGGKIKLTDFQGKYVYMGVWATWCEPCKRELRNFKKLVHAYRHKNIVFLTVSIDNYVNKEGWKDLIDEKKFGGLHTIVPPKNKFNDDYMIISVPRFIMIDPSGKIVSADAVRPSGKIDAFIDSVMGESKSE